MQVILTSYCEVNFGAPSPEPLKLNLKPSSEGEKYAHAVIQILGKENLLVSKTYPKVGISFSEW